MNSSVVYLLIPVCALHQQNDILVDPLQLPGVYSLHLRVHPAIAGQQAPATTQSAETGTHPLSIGQEAKAIAHPVLSNKHPSDQRRATSTCKGLKVQDQGLMD